MEMHRVNVIGIVITLGQNFWIIVVLFAEGARQFFSPKLSVLLWEPFSLVFSGYRNFHGEQSGRDVNLIAHHVNEVKNSGAIPPFPHMPSYTAKKMTLINFNNREFYMNFMFLIIKPTRCINFSNLFWKETIHVSDSSSVHHQEFFTVHTAMVYVIQVCW